MSSNVVKQAPLSSNSLLPIFLVVVVAIVMLMSFLTMGLGLLSFMAFDFTPKPMEKLAAKQLPPHPSLPLARAETVAQAREVAISREQEARTIQKLLGDVRQRQTYLAEAIQRQQSDAQALQTTKSKLTEDVEKQQQSLKEAEEAVRRFQEEHQRVSQRITALKLEAADLEKQAAALRKDIAEARRTAELAIQKRRTVQFVECVNDGIVLRPQLTKIPYASLDNGALASIAKERGVYFLVRPDGFTSFNRAYKISLDEGSVIGFEPSKSANTATADK
jgi:seryl-tRNA synthetase